MSTPTITRSSVNGAAPAAPVKVRTKRSAPAWSSKAAVNLMLVLFCLYTLLPLTWLVVASTKSTADLYGTPGFAFGDMNFIPNLVTLFTWENGTYLRWLLNTVAYAGVGSVFSVFVSFLAGYAFDKFDFPGKERWFAFILVGVLIPAAVTTMPLYLLAANIGLVNTFWGVFLPSIASPFGVYLARVFSNGYVPAELIEAARLDGAGEMRIFTTIVAPLMKPGIVTLLLMSFSAAWNNIFLPLVMLTDNQLFPIALGLYSWNGRSDVEPEFAQLTIIGSLIAIIPVIVMFMSLQRFWKAGLGSGAIK
ncbi:multiple sugar transport system permease protein [Arthrobacter stackebrandtii]|uniref:Multiple sugar transport system permease protein n=1 Tax=Arthrobacter stackebrandtii TaxID=272161 RepID=A0ABS4YWB8_9MICC|nr:carbohydrate ABC transporter permease [Arthrobacter stackebrandtii]MBP2412775.1 multiple sugar transport system permease protein [Arthrobacter stackebrandtii]PYG99869.1 sugar ABC transporter permease [Arthrobacter stackebrandtii]